MTVDELLDAVDRVLATEREAIVRLDADVVETTATDKEGLFAALQSATFTESHGPRLAKILEAAKQNCLLLANARELTRQTVATLSREVNGAAIESGSAASSGQLGSATARRGVRLSVTG
jgi:hypothetical protein